MDEPNIVGPWEDSEDGERRLWINPAEIRRQREQGWPDFHPEDFCHECGCRNLKAWSVDSDRFNAAMGSPNHIVCPQCFVARWEQATGLRAVWQLVPESIYWPDEETMSGTTTGDDSA